ncbi:segregation and condensation protein B [Weissella uvarum]|uniref:SMC-Scp complex subunit ScpB n=1 Tax=Weissella uvarum TaxID=1479233 RepID=UPI0019610ECA|nr:SMC-Scp complex subunit ScpB [Weissella uvarum]MBM7617074.1 segregation and condensation protein B [Weissella uvarum]MCM0595372.1 SMC-Scp complex subunit ScpB [Weissella uvarum]
MSNEAQIEALLFVSGDEGIKLSEMTAATELSADTVLATLQKLQEKYEHDDESSLMLVKHGDQYQLVTKAALATIIHNYFTAPITSNLSQSALEVLAIVAYQQPITRIAVDEIRGVKSHAMLQKLVLRNLISVQGRSDEVGRPNLYGTTDYFLDYFGLDQITDLPDLGTAQTLQNLQSSEAVPEEVPLFEEHPSAFATDLIDESEKE